MKVLLSAYSCEPGQGSEPGIGWNVAREVAKYNEVWVLTRPDESGAAIEAELARNPVPNLHFVYFTLPLWANSWKSGQAIQFHYYLWQIQAYFVARRLQKEIGFDGVQHVTFGKYLGPSFLALLPVPFIWGPVGGGESTPHSFRAGLSFRGKVYETLRDWARWLGEHDWFVHLTAKRCALALATTKDTAIRLHALEARRVDVMGACGLSSEEIKSLGSLPIPTANPLRFISIGRLLHWKGFDLGLRAFAIAALVQAEYWIIGDGPERERLQVLANELGITPQVKFWKNLPRDEALLKLGECHVLVHPSLHDSGGWVCLEAMAAGRPVLCLDLGGPATQVTEETGFKVPAHAPEQATGDIAEAMTRLVHDPELLFRLGQAGQRRVREVYDWQVKGQFFHQLYEKIFTERE